MPWNEKNIVDVDDIRERGSSLKKKSLDQSVNDLVTVAGMIIEHKSRLALGRLPASGWELMDEKHMDEILEMAKPLIHSKMMEMAKKAV